MKFFLLDLLSRQKPGFAFLRKYPEKMGLKTWKLMEGAQVDPKDMPDDRILMSPEERGLEVPDLVANTCSMLIFSRRLKETLEALEVPRLQYLPVKIINHKKRVASADHFIINPLGAVDILDTKASDIEWLDGEVVAIETMVVDPKKAKKAPDLLRVKEDPAEYLFSERLLEKWRAMRPKPTNITFTELDFS